MGVGLATVDNDNNKGQVVTGVDTCNGSPGHVTEQEGVDHW